MEDYKPDSSIECSFESVVTNSSNNYKNFVRQAWLNLIPSDTKEAISELTKEQRFLVYKRFDKIVTDVLQSIRQDRLTKSDLDDHLSPNLFTL